MKQKTTRTAKQVDCINDCESSKEFPAYKSATQVKFNSNTSPWLKMMFAFISLVGSAMYSFGQAIVTIPVETEKNVLLLQTDKDNRLGIVYFGKRLGNANEYASVAGQYNLKDDNAGIYNSAYTSAGTWNLVEPAVQVTHADGNTSLELKYISSDVKKIDANISLAGILLKDPAYGLEVTLYYKTYFKENVVEQWS
ncbi:MAG: glycoside hydrolase family 36 N-terminal domain-containing protein, partial [Panacibacter sp.]